MKKSGERFIFRYVELKKTYEKKQQNKTKLKDCQVIFKRLSTVEKISFCKKYVAPSRRETLHAMRHPGWATCHEKHF